MFLYALYSVFPRFPFRMIYYSYLILQSVGQMMPLMGRLVMSELEDEGDYTSEAFAAVRSNRVLDAKTWYWKLVRWVSSICTKNFFFL